MRHYYLTLRAPLHVGEFIGIEREAALDYIPSDTLFAALVTAWAQQGVDLAPRLAACQNALRLSSAFPYAKTVLFYPMPLGLRIHWGAASPAIEGKQRKRIRWVSQAIFKRLCQYQPLNHECGPDNFLHEGSVWLSQAEYQLLSTTIARSDDGHLRLWTHDLQEKIVPRVTIDRVSNAANLFHNGRVSFAAGCGLWFASQTEHDDWVEAALNGLADSGLGGLRSVGNGAFAWRSEAQPLSAVQHDYGILLSRFAPRGADEIEHSLLAAHSAYRLITIGGWCHDDAGKAWRRKRVRMVAEGACLPSSAQGQLVDVKPDGVMQRPVYRFGVALQVGVSKEALYA